MLLFDEEHVCKVEMPSFPFVKLKFSVYGRKQTDIHKYLRKGHNPHFLGLHSSSGYFAALASNEYNLITSMTHSQVPAVGTFLTVYTVISYCN